MEREPKISSDDGTGRGPLIAAGTLLGIGLGGLLDGILLRQLLQWHTMLSNRLAADDVMTLKHSMFWDGLFYAGTWAAACIGLALLFNAGKRLDVVWSTRAFAGSLVLGWGLLTLVEGVINHHILDWHHVRPGENQQVWDLSFLLFGAVLMAIGASVIRASRRDRIGRGQGLPGSDYAQTRRAHAVP